MFSRATRSVLFILLIATAAKAQSVTVTVSGPSVKLSTVDSVSVAPARCNGIVETIMTADAVAALAIRMVTVNMTLPAGSVVSVNGNVVTFSTTSKTAVIGLSANPTGAALSTNSVTVTGP